MNAIKFLLKEHDHVRRAFADISDASHRPQTKLKLFVSLCQELLVHEKMEQTVWYPRFNNEDKLKTIVQHLLSEEQSAEEAIKEFRKIISHDQWEEKFKRLRMDVEHHASEEENKLFPKVTSILDEEELEEIGEKMIKFKSECLKAKEAI
ncbi:MAG TPA: hemerythrin domain-containing protein [Gammaproteobacteria bacterium]|nr:hemerythrin domain-containing protein [Gammaproteobacteria bacterium]